MAKSLTKDERVHIDKELRLSYNRCVNKLHFAHLEVVEPLKKQLSVRYSIPSFEPDNRCTSNSMCPYYKVHEDLPYLRNENLPRTPYSMWGEPFTPNAKGRNLMIKNASPSQLEIIAKTFIKDNTNGNSQKAKLEFFKVAKATIATKTDKKNVRLILKAEKKLRDDVETVQERCDEFFAEAIIAGRGVKQVEAFKAFKKTLIEDLLK